MAGRRHEYTDYLRDFGCLSASLLPRCQGVHSIQSRRLAVATHACCIRRALILWIWSQIELTEQSHPPCCRCPAHADDGKEEPRATHSYTGNATAIGVRTTRTEYASSTTVSDLASSHRSGLPAAVSAPMQGRQSVRLVPPVNVSSAPPSPCSPSHLSTPQSARPFAESSSTSSLHLSIETSRW